ncbi:MAG: hypothetical protein EXR36_02865 [Betaproteobacteria bacterium]|nr:hypothetical protein [Betaproteobacteria bacterium]
MADGKGTNSGALYAIADDGITEPRLQRYAADGGVRTLARSRIGTRIDVRGDGVVLASQMEICNGHDVYFDLYRIEAGGANLAGPKRLTQCGRYFRAVWGSDGSAIFALKHVPGKQHLVRLDERGGNEQVLLHGTDDVQWTDLAAMPGGQRIAITGKRENKFVLYEFYLALQSLQARHAGPVMHSPHYQGGTLYFLSGGGNVYNVWRLTPPGLLERVTHAHTAVTAFGGVDDSGQLALATLSQGQFRMHRLRGANPLETSQAQAEVASATPTPPPRLPWKARLAIALCPPWHPGRGFPSCSRTATPSGWV